MRKESGLYALTTRLTLCAIQGQPHRCLPTDLQVAWNTRRAVAVCITKAKTLVSLYSCTWTA